MYIPLTSASSVFSLPLSCYMIADSGYDDRKLYEYSKKVLGIDLVVCPVVERYESTPKRDLIWFAFINRYWDRQSTTREEYL